MADEQKGLLARLMTETWPARAGRGILDALMLPGQVAGGILNVQPERPGYWSDTDEARSQLTNQTMMNRATDLGGLMMLGSTAAPAVRNAVGSGVRTTLPMDDASRMGRAAEQGYTVDAYKGMTPYHPDSYPTTRGFEAPPPHSKLPSAELTSINANRGPDNPISSGAGFFSDSPAVASRFAGLFENGAVYPVKLKFENPKVIDAQGRFAADFQFGPGAGQLKLPKDSPHDGVILKNTKDEGTVYIPNTPQQIRSRFAAFDPANAGSAGLLGGLAALMMAPQENR